MEAFNVRWADHSKKLIEDIYQKLLQQQLVDVVLSCEGRTIKCHRLILSAFSPYFDEIISQHPTPNLVIVLNQVKLWELEALINFMYNGEVTVMSEQRFRKLCVAAERLKIKGLIQNDDKIDAVGLGASGITTMDSSHKRMVNLLHYGSAVPTPQRCVPQKQQPKLVSSPKVVMKPKETSRSLKSIPDLLKVPFIGQPSGAGVPLAIQQNKKTTALKGNQVRSQGSVKEGNRRGESAVNDVSVIGLGPFPQEKAVNLVTRRVNKGDENRTNMGVNGDDSSKKQSGPQYNYEERKIKLEAAAKRAVELRNVKRAAAEHEIPRTTLINYMKRRRCDPFPEVSQEGLVFCGFLGSDSPNSANGDVGGEDVKDSCTSGM